MCLRFVWFGLIHPGCDSYLLWNLFSSPEVTMGDAIHCVGDGARGVLIPAH
jgi:hypothetical protein